MILGEKHGTSYLPCTIRKPRPNCCKNTVGDSVGLKNITISREAISTSAETPYFVLNARNYTTFSAQWGVPLLNGKTFFEKPLSMGFLRISH